VVSSDTCRRLIAEGEPALARIPTDHGLAGPGGRLATLAARVVQEALFRAEYVYDYGMPQWLARLDRLASPLRPERLFLGRHKFAHFRAWYRGPLAAYVRDVLLDPRARARPYLDGRRLEAMVAAHTGGRGNYTLEIHRALTLELLHRLFIDAR
jgi:asparagine synthase (glutamine-hydrolysing)